MAGGIRHLFLLYLTACLIAAPGDASASQAAMKAPGGSSNLVPDEASGWESQSLLGAIRFFQEYVSPTDGARCQFSPSCSHFGHQAIREHGPWLGILMTADRLMRCSPWTDPTLYPRAPDGHLADPVADRKGE